MTDFIPCGIPLQDDYKKIISSKNFKDMEKFSEFFISIYKEDLQEYIYKWVEDPLHQWSRQWEYPYVYSKIMHVVNKHNNVNINILDAGSGATFFPYFLKKKINDSSIFCCDNDISLKNVYQKINDKIKGPLKFSNSDLRDLKFENESLDIIYCVSVIEHTKNYEKVVKEFYRVLKFGGSLIVTFDISIDGLHDISIDRANSLLSFFENIFKDDYLAKIDLRSDLKVSEIFTTITANNMNKKLLPWKRFSFSRIKLFIKNMKYSPFPPLLTVFCLTLKKHA
jgi:ubiquinone/menaquinone biosynthesis C-methylase UbiE